jgi:hypothetical protein
VLKKYLQLLLALCLHLISNSSIIVQSCIYANYTKTAVDETIRWATLPVEKPNVLEQGLTIKKIIGYGSWPVMVAAKYSNNDVFVKCSYHLRSIKQDEKVNKVSDSCLHSLIVSNIDVYVLLKARRSSDESANRYFVNYLHSFKVGMPYGLATKLNKYKPIGWINYIVPSFDTCIVTEYVGEKTLESNIDVLPPHRIGLRMYQLIYQTLDGKRR